MHPEKPLPHNLEAERSILASILLDSRTIYQAQQSLTKEDFFLDSHKRTYAAMLRLLAQEKAIDPITLQEALKQANDLALVGGAIFLGALIDGATRLSNIEEYCKLVKSKSMLRKLIAASTQIINQALSGDDEPQKLLTKARVAIANIEASETDDDLVWMDKAADIALERITQRWVRPDDYGLSLGLHSLDRGIGQLEGDELIVLAATPGCGKSTLAHQIAISAVAPQKREPVVMFVSLEMSHFQITRRMIATISELDAQDIRSGRLSNEDKRKVVIAADALRTKPIVYVDRSQVSPYELVAKIEKVIQQKQQIDLIIIDYAQLLSSDGNDDSENARITAVMAGLRRIIRRYKAPVIVLSQLNRTQRREKRKPQLHDLRGSGSIEQDASIVVFIHNENSDDDEANPRRLLIVAKNRDGISDIELPVAFIKNECRFAEIYTERPEF